MTSIRRSGFAILKVFKGSPFLYKLGKKVYPFVSSNYPRKNQMTIKGPFAVLRVNADYSEEGYYNIRELIKDFKVPFIVALKMEDLEKEKKFITYSKNLERLNCSLALHGYHHSTILPLLNSKQKQYEIKKAVTTFKAIFKKTAKGFFSSRNAYDNESLRILSSYGIKYYAEKNILYPEKHFNMWDIGLNKKLFDPISKSWKLVVDYIIKNKGIISVCWHIDSMGDEKMGYYREFLSYIKEKNVEILSESKLLRRLR
ncbi:hypothetical protein DRN74_02160 [Candidatus Micrarchaeota archaeon]|nr:MAG: hypothetical protein DRN74_02160 [Candidatus Micrarchaeota archaeon]